jgi:hypothetical protein
MDTAVRYIKKRLRMNLGSCVLKHKEIGRVLAGCVICELCSRTGRSCTCVRILEEL